MSQEATTGLASSLIGTVLSGRYRLESKLGSGGMSTVYLARDETLQRWVAVKVMHREMSDQPDQLERFRREARAVAQLSHPNVVAVIDAGEDGGHPYIVFEYVEGETLKQRIDRLGRLPVVEAAAYGIEVGRGLAAAHAQRLIHRDVKPQNVLIDPEGRAKVTDFGIARSLESDGLTKTGRVLGTTDYVAPEQAMGQAVDARCDIYSLGVLLYEMLTGEVPFQADTLVGVAMKHVNEEMPDVQERCPGVSSALAAVIERATAKEPKKRYPDMVAMLADLEGALEVEVARGGGAHGEATNVLDAIPASRRLLTPRRASAAGIVLVLAGGRRGAADRRADGQRRVVDGRRGAAGRGDRARPTPKPSIPPPGDGEEHDSEASLAIDCQPGHDLDHRDLQRVAGHRGRGRQARGRPDRGRRAAGRRKEPDDPLGHGRLEPGGVRRRLRPADDARGLGQPDRRGARHGHRADGRAQRDRALAVLPALDHRGRLGRQRQQRGDRRRAAIHLG